MTTTISPTAARRRSARLAALGLLAFLVPLLAPAPASAARDNHGLPPVEINPAGGELEGAADGIRMVFNSNGTIPQAGWIGGEQVFYAGTYQYCCSSSAPMLNIGGTLYGEAGPANSSGTSTGWTSFEIVETTGSAVEVTGEETRTTGSGSAVFRYTADVEGLVYVLTRTVTYTYPNNFFEDRYEIEIPEGNTDVVKFYLGGDTAPGSSDSGTAVMTTEPVRTVYSVNPFSEIQLGYGEIPGEAPFDGATAYSFFTPYAVVQAGDDIGFIADTENHDAGIMIQWTIGSEAGVHERALQHVVGERGAALRASFGTSEVEAPATAELALEILNTGDTEITGTGFALDLPAGLTLADVAPVNGCGGTLTATAGSTEVTLADVTIAGAGNCVVTVTVDVPEPGEYVLGPDLVTSLTSLQNTVGLSTLTAPTPEEPEPEPEPEPEAPACEREVVGEFAGASGDDGSVARLYLAVFGRQPDAAGHAYWIQQLDDGLTLAEVADWFMAGREYELTYADRDDATFIGLVYTNVLCRDADSAGETYWLDELSAGLTNEHLLLLFSESAEFRLVTGTD